jgi:glycosyltransferase involved in cell wall biosynthesis
MAEVIGLIYGHNENWIAGSYYIQNLAHALNHLKEKPALKIYSESEEDFEKLRSVTQYPMMAWVPLKDSNTLLDKAVNKLSVSLLSKHVIVRGIDSGVDLLFPASETFYFDKIRNKLFWIPDFQEKHYPNFFSEEEIRKRKDFQQWIVKNNYPIVFSSEHSSGDFHELYPHAKNRTFVMPFAVTLPDFSNLKMEEVTRKFQIPGPYFICSNQFWAHKNHETVLRAVRILKLKNIPVTVLFTGKPYDNRNPDYFPSLERFVVEHELQQSVKFLGFIDRAEQLLLMKNSYAIIQPSLFEGWSTVVEDAKALDVPIVVSDIPVHREQLLGYPLFFAEKDENKLSFIMERIIAGERPVPSVNYTKAILTFGEKFMSIARAVRQNI